MIQFLRSFLTVSSRKPASAPAKKLGIDLASIEGALKEDQKFLRPQWKVIRTWVKENVAGEDIPCAWQEIAANWLAKLQGQLAGSYFVSESANFLLLTSRSRDASRSILGTCEMAVQFLVKWLGPIAEKRGHGKHVILDFATRESYYDYISYFYPPDSHTASSGGVFLGGGYQHIALPPSQGLQDVLIHELTHNRLAHLPLPAWVEEGIAVTMERRIGGKKHGMLDRELHRKHSDYWTPQTITAFWKGKSFKDPDGEVSHLSYSLAEILVDLMVQEFPNFMEFVAHARHEDAGLAAAKDIFGVDLNDIIATFLGPGDWTSDIPNENSK